MQKRIEQLEAELNSRNSQGQPTSEAVNGSVPGHAVVEQARPGGIAPPGGNTGSPGSVVPGFTPDLRKTDNRLDIALMVVF
jgi:hypothetical protein